MEVYPKLIYRFYIISIRILADLLVEIDKLILKFTWNCKGPRIAKTKLKKNKVVELTLLKTIEVKMVCYWSKDRHTQISGRE